MREDLGDHRRIFDGGDDLHLAAITVAGMGGLRVANARFCERAALRECPVLADLGPKAHCRRSPPANATLAAFNDTLAMDISTRYPW